MKKLILLLLAALVAVALYYLLKPFLETGPPESREVAPLDITALAEDGDTLWYGTQIGAVRMNKRDGSKTLFQNTDSGMPPGGVTAIAVQKPGTVWIGTTHSLGGGLARFDGVHWRVYNSSNSGMPGDNVTALAVDSKGSLCVGTDLGLARFDGSSWSVYGFENGPLPAAEVTALAVSGDRLWVGTKPLVDLFRNQVGGLAVYDGANWKTLNTDNSPLPHDYVTCLAVGNQGEVWVGLYAGGAARIEGDTVTPLSPDKGEVPFKSLSCLAVGASGELWAGAAGTDFYGETGLAVLRGDNWKVLTDDSSRLPSDCVNAVLAGSDGVTWVGVYVPVGRPSTEAARRGCLVRFDGTSWTAIEDPPNASKVELNEQLCVTAAAEDAAGRMWFATPGGLISYNGGRWEGFQVANTKLPSDNLTSLAVDRSGRLWAGASTYVPVSDERGEGGVGRFDGESWQTYDRRDSGLSSNQVLGLAFDPAGKLWCAALPQQVLLEVYDRSSWRRSRVPKEIKSAEKPGGVAGFDGREWRRLDVAGAPTDARCVAFDAQGRLWAGTNDGVAVWDGRSWTLPMKNDDQLPSKTVRALAVDQKGDIWMATYHGLARYDGKAFTRYNRTNSGIPADDIRSVAVDRSGAVWIGAAFSGLAKFDGAAWTLFSTDNSGLPHDDVYSLYFDRGGHLWVGAGRWDEKRPKGYRLATFDGKNWRTFAASDLNPAPKSER